MLVEMTWTAEVSEEVVAEMLGRSHASINISDFEIVEDKMINELDCSVRLKLDGQTIGNNE